MVMVPPAGIALAGLKTMETMPKVGKPPTISPVTKERDVKMLTLPPIAGEAVRAALSTDVETEMPVRSEATGGPIVAPPSVMVYEPLAATLS